MLKSLLIAMQLTEVASNLMTETFPGRNFHKSLLYGQTANVYDIQVLFYSIKYKMVASL